MTLRLTRQTQKRLRLAGWMLVVIGWGMFLVFNWLLFFHMDIDNFGRYDFLAYEKAAETFLRGESPYDATLGSAYLYLYPPLLAQLLMPIVALIGEGGTTLVWYFLNIACLLGIIHLMRRYIPNPYHMGLWAFPVLFIPITHAFYIGQVTLILTYLLAWVWHSARHHHHLRAGMLLALASWIKVFPAFLVIFFLLRRDWRVIVGVAIGGIGLAGAQILISGIDVMRQSFEVIFTLLDEGQTGSLFKNSSITSFTARLFTDHPQISPLVVDDSLFSLSRYVLMGVFLCATYGIVAWHDKHDAIAFDFGFCATLVMALLMGYTFWVSGMPPYMLVFLVILCHMKGIGSWLMVVCAVVLSLYFPLLINIGEQRLPWWSLYTLGFYASVGVWAVLVVSLFRRRKAGKMTNAAMNAPNKPNSAMTPAAISE